MPRCGTFTSGLYGFENPFVVPEETNCCFVVLPVSVRNNQVLGTV